MKKLGIALAIAIAAACGNAASVQWSMSSITDSPDAAKAAGWAAYFMDGSTYSAFSALTADKVGEYVAANYTYTGTTAAGRGGAVGVTQTTGTYSAGDEVSAYIGIFNSSDASTATYYAATALDTKSVPSSGNLQWTKEFATTTSGWQTTAVPEPNSGLLMLLGMAGLALRRRRA